MNCPICAQKVDSYFESKFPAFEHQCPHISLVIYGSYSSPDEIICRSEEYIHFQFEYPVLEHRLIRLNCEEDKLDILI